MEEETQAGSDVPVMKVVDNIESIVHPTKAENGDLHQQETEGKKEEEETAFEGGFIKVEKESFDEKHDSHSADAPSAGDHQSSMFERSSRILGASRELLETQEKMKELELELERVVGALKHSETVNTQLKQEVSHTKEKLEESGMKYKELELNHKKVQEQIAEAEEKYSSQINTLSEALQAQEAKHKELIDVKESFDGLSLELESSRKRLQELEHELQLTAGQAQKFEELHKQSGSHAESETQRATEFETLLELAKVTAKEMEDQMASLQEELKGLYEKIAENQKVEVALTAMTADLSAVQGELEISKSQVLDMEKRLSSKESLIDELTQELHMRKASESQVKEDILALENLFAATKEDLQGKVLDLEGIQLKLQEEMHTRELAEGELKSQQAQVLTVQEELMKVIKEKETLEAALADLTNNAVQMKELCSDLETKLKASDENFCKADSLLSQALSNNAELEQKLKSLEELHLESGSLAASATQKTLELQDIIQVSTSAAEEAKSQLRELETRFLASEQKNVELEQQLNLVELKSSDTERELKDLSETVSELNGKLREGEEEKNRLNGQIQEYVDKIAQLEDSLSLASQRNSEIEMELKNVVEKCAEHEGRANMTHQRSLELEDLIQMSHSKVDDAGKKVGELELLLAAEKYRIQELEDNISTLEKKCGDAEAESNKFSDKVSELAAELEAFQAKSSSLEVALQTANENEKELTESLSITKDEKKRLEEELISSIEKRAEAENLQDVLRNELSLAQEKLESIENDLKAAGMKDSEIMEKLKSAEEQLEQQGKVLDQATARNSELESLHETRTRDSELKLQEAIETLTNRDSEVKSLYEKLKNLEEQVKIYEEQVVEASEKSVLLKAELDQNSTKLASLETTNEELKMKFIDAEEKVAQSSSENEMLVDTNIQLKSKVNELEELLRSTSAEKEVIVQQLDSHKNTLSELTDQHSRAIEVHSATEARIVEAETQLQEAILKFTHRDSEAKDLFEKLNALEGQIKLYEEQAHGASAVAETQKIELEETHKKLKALEIIAEELQTKLAECEKQNEGLAEVNLKITQELAMYEPKINDLQGKLSAVLVEKDENIEQLNFSKKTIEDLSQQLRSDAERLQSQISAVMEEKNQLEGKLGEEKANEDSLKAEIEKLKAEIAEKSVLQPRIKELEEQLIIAEAQWKEEVEKVKSTAAKIEGELTSKLEDHARKVEDRDMLNEKVVQLQREFDLTQTTLAEQKEVVSQKELEQEAAIQRKLEEFEAKSKEVTVLEKQVKELEQKLELADAKLKEKVDGGNPSEPVEVKSRDIGSTFSAPTKRKSKKKSEATPSQASSSSKTEIPTTEHSSAMTLKLVLGVALLSVIVGIILGKRY